MVKQQENDLNDVENLSDVHDLSDEGLLEDIQALPPEQRDVVAKCIQQVKISSYSGPLPPAKELEGYEHVLPGSADRILVMAEENLKHNRSCEVMSLKESHKYNSRGQSFAFVLAVLAIVLAIVLVLFGNSTGTTIAGIVFGISGITPIITVFLRNFKDA